MITPGADERGRIVRVLTYGKETEAVDRAVVEAVEDGHRVLVKVASADTPAGVSAVADWAEALSQAYGMAWERVGGDVLFQISLTRIRPETP